MYLFCNFRQKEYLLFFLRLVLTDAFKLHQHILIQKYITNKFYLI